jgi:TonB family protein
MEHLRRRNGQAAPEIQVIDRALLKGYLEKERIPSERLHESEYRAIGADLHATSVLIGTTSRFDDNAIQLSARMLSVEEADHIGNSAEVNLLAPVSSVDLSPSDSYASFSPRLQSSNRVDLYPAGVNGVGLPSCTYMPNPPYSEVARKFRVNGSLIVEAVVTAEGKLHDFRIVRGLPGGLNENTLATLKTWRCSPPLRNGKPVPVAVPFEVNFRLY